jgi:hypothetical protein
VFPNDLGDASQLRLAESIVVRHSHRSKPELRELAVPPHVNVEWFVSVAGEEEKPERAAVENGWTHASDSASYMKGLPNPGFRIRLTFLNDGAVLGMKAQTGGASAPFGG